MSGNFMDKPSVKYKQTVQILQQLLKEEGEENVTRAFAEASYEARKNAYSKSLGIELSSSGHVCIHRLLGNRCPNEECKSPQIIPGSDHCSEWKKEGNTFVIVSQPYGIRYENIKNTITFCEEYGLEADINARLSWHFPGSTICIEYKRKENSK